MDIKDFVSIIVINKIHNIKINENFNLTVVQLRTKITNVYLFWLIIGGLHVDIRDSKAI